MFQNLGYFGEFIFLFFSFRIGVFTVLQLRDYLPFIVVKTLYLSVIMSNEPPHLSKRGVSPKNIGRKISAEKYRLKTIAIKRRGITPQVHESKNPRKGRQSTWHIQ